MRLGSGDLGLRLLAGERGQFPFEALVAGSERLEFRLETSEQTVQALGVLTDPRAGLSCA